MQITISPDFPSAMKQPPGPGFHLALTKGVPTQLVVYCPICGVGPTVLALQGGPHNPGEHRWTLLLDNGLVTVVPSIILKCCGAHFYLAHNKVITGFQSGVPAGG